MQAIAETRIFDDVIALKYEVHENLEAFDAYYKLIDEKLSFIE